MLIIFVVIQYSVSCVLFHLLSLHHASFYPSYVSFEWYTVISLQLVLVTCFLSFFFFLSFILAVLALLLLFLLVRVGVPRPSLFLLFFLFFSILFDQVSPETSLPPPKIWDELYLPHLLKRKKPKLLRLFEVFFFFFLTSARELIIWVILAIQMEFTPNWTYQSIKNRHNAAQKRHPTRAQSRRQNLPEQRKIATPLLHPFFSVSKHTSTVKIVFFEV